MTDNERRLPPSWRWVKLGEVCEHNIANRDPGQHPDDYFTYVDISSVDNQTKQIVFPKFIRGAEAPSRARQVIQTDDILVATTRPNLNAVAIVSSSLDGQICSTGFCVLRVGPQINAKYLFAYVQSVDFVKSLSELVTGALYPAVTDRQVYEQRIPLPSLAEQIRIADSLSVQLVVANQAHKAAEAQLVAARQMPIAYLNQLFTPKRFSEAQWQYLAEIATLLPARSLQSQGDTEVKAITTACLTEKGFNPAGIKPARVQASDIADCTVSAGEVLIARSNTPDLVGRVAVFPGLQENIVASDLTIRIWAGPELIPEFLSAYLSFLYASGYWKERAGGASGTMKKITRTQLLEVKVPVPSLQEQQQVVFQFKRFMENTVRLQNQIFDQLDAINRLPAAILRRAFNGEL